MPRVLHWSIAGISSGKSRSEACTADLTLEPGLPDGRHGSRLCWGRACKRHGEVMRRGGWYVY